MKALVVLAVLLAMTLGARASGPQALQEIARWRAAQDKKMRGPNSPFAVERVELLHKERNTAGRAPESDIRLDAPEVPAVAAIAVVRGSNVLLQAKAPALRLNGKPFQEAVLKTADHVTIGPFTLQYRRPNGNPALRISNMRGASMLAYKGLKYYPPDLKYRVPASFTPAAGAAKMITVESTQGGPQQLPYAGKLAFELDGKHFELDAFIDEDAPKELFVIYKDSTNGHETYPVGRYVYVARGNPTVLDFNQSFNPLCAYGSLFFCPIPPRQNHLAIPIPAGEKIYHEDTKSTK